MIALICTQSDLTNDYRIHKLSTTLEAAGFQVKYLTRSHSRHKCQETNSLHIMQLLTERGPLFYLEFNLRLIWHLLKTKVDLVVSIDLDTLMGCYIGSKLSRKQLLFDSHEYFPESPEIAHKPFVKWVWKKVQDAFVPRVKYNVTVCQSIADKFNDLYGKNFLVVRNAPLQAERRNSQGTVRTDSRFTILFQGMINIGRHVDTIIRALPSLPDCRFLVVGEGDVYQDARNLARQLNVEDRVEFTGLRPYGELGRYMGVADLGVCLFDNISLNYYWCLPNRLFDFIHAGLPMLAVDFPEIKRVIEGYNIGRCMHQPTVDNVVKEINYIRSNPQKVQQWKNNMKIAAEQLTWEHDAEPLLAVLKQINR